MAKRKQEILIETDTVPGGWAVYVDSEYDKQIAELPGVRAALRNMIPGVLFVMVDPRYDLQELECEIYELCR